MSILIRYTQIPFYFRFSITSSASLIHLYAPPHWRDCTRTCFVGPIWLILWTHDLQFTCFTSILSIPNMCPPMVQPIMSPCTTWSGTFYSFASDEPYARFLVYHSYLACLYFTFHSEHHQRREPQPIAYMSFPQKRDLALTPHLTLHLFHIISHCIALPHNHTVFTLHHTWRWSLTSRSHPQSPIGFILRSPAP